MKQYDQDRQNPDNKKEREKRMASIAAKKPSKKMSVAALAHWHGMQMEHILGEPAKR